MRRYVVVDAQGFIVTGATGGDLVHSAEDWVTVMAAAVLDRRVATLNNIEACRALIAGRGWRVRPVVFHIEDTR
jgi:hypothetical protein